LVAASWQKCTESARQGSIEQQKMRPLAINREARMSDPVHARLTRKSKYQYVFTAKHHGGGKADDARWSEEVSMDEEFGVFDEADFCDIFDRNGRIYGVLRGADGSLRDLGTWKQQIAEFPKADQGVPWHGYPIWSVNEIAPSNRAGQKARPAKEIFQKLEAAGLMTVQEWKRLYKGAHA
jgi:hypothetical protein